VRFSNWDINGFDRGIAAEFYRNGINPLVSVLLASRGKTDLDEVYAFLGDDPFLFHDPFLMADMDKAVSRIKKAVDACERIAVYGDYDVDGMTACAIVAIWLRSKGANFEIYIPGRFDEGYGLNNAALDTLKARGAELVITVDCGITAIEEAIYAESIGLDLIITDHHECRDDLPVAIAVVDPKRFDCDYPFKSLAGVGVAFKLINALESDHLSDEIFRLYSEFVAVGTVADVMPVTGENRELIKRGLNILNSNPRHGFRSLLQEAGIEPGNITASTIGYMIAPRINAAGRMGQAGLSVELLLSDDYEESDRLAIELCRLNSERRNLELEIYEEATAMLPKTLPDEPIILARQGWYQGVTGIIAAKMAERHRLPVIIISIGDDAIGRGSCRSFGSFSIYDALCTCEDILETYGGHEMAAGVTVTEENIDELRRRITKYYHDNIKSLPESGLKVDFEVEKPELLILKNIEALDDLEPFGNGNPSPCLCMFGAIVLQIQSIGAGKHSKLKIEKSGIVLDCIFFSAPAGDLGVSVGMLADLVFEPQVNEFKGRSSVQLQLFDIRRSGT